jgi:NitT/TauT family transport system substrate-binding protein
MLMGRTEPDGSFDWSSLEGQSVLSWRVGSMPALFLEHILRERDIDPASDLEIITNVAAPARYGAFMAGTGDVGTFFEPDVSRMERDGTGVVLASVGQAVGDVDYTVFMATDTFIEENPDIVQAWTNAIHKAQMHVQEGDPMAIAEAVTGYFPEVDVELIASSIERYRDLGMWKETPLVMPEAMEALQDLMVEGGLLDGDARVPYEDIVVTTFAETAIETAGE